MEVINSIKCARCGGEMTAAKYWDLQATGTGFYQYTCINCGEVIDETILRNRALLAMPITKAEFKRAQRIAKNAENKRPMKKDANQSVPPLRMAHR